MVSADGDEQLKKGRGLIEKTLLQFKKDCLSLIIIFSLIFHLWMLWRVLL